MNSATAMIMHKIWSTALLHLLHIWKKYGESTNHMLCKTQNKPNNILIRSQARQHSSKSGNIFLGILLHDILLLDFTISFVNLAPTYIQYSSTLESTVSTALMLGII